jgi:hypothetical protein
MKSSLFEMPPSVSFNLIPTGGEHIQLQSDYGAYRFAIRSLNRPNTPGVVNSIGANNAALRFQRSFLLPGACPGSIGNPRGVPIQLSALQATDPGFDEESDNPGLGPLVLNLGPLR